MSQQILKNVFILVTLVAMTQQKTCLCGKTKDKFSMSIDYNFEITNNHVLQQLTKTVQEYQKLWHATKVFDPNEQTTQSNQGFNPLPMLTFVSIDQVDAKLKTGNQQRQHEKYEQYIVTFNLSGYDFEVLIGSGKKQLFENTVIFQESPQNTARQQLFAKGMFDANKAQFQIKEKSNTFKKLSLSNQKRIFLGYDICNNFLIFIRKFSNQILSFYNEAIVEFGRKDNLNKSQQKWQNYSNNLHNEFLDVTNLSSQQSIQGCDKQTNQNLFQELSLINLTEYMLVRYQGQQQKSVYYLTNKRTQVAPKAKVTKVVKNKQVQENVNVRNVPKQNRQNIVNTAKKQQNLVQERQKQFVSKIPKIQQKQNGNQTTSQRQNINQQTTNDQSQSQQKKIVYENDSQSRLKKPTPINEMVQQRQTTTNNELKRVQGNTNLVQNGNQSQTGKQKLVFKKGNINQTRVNNSNVPVLKINLSDLQKQQKQNQILEHIQNNKEQIRQNIQNFKNKKVQLKRQSQDESTEELRQNLQGHNEQPMTLNLENLQKLNQMNKQKGSDEFPLSSDQQRSFSQDDLSDDSTQANIDSSDQEEINEIVKEEIQLVQNEFTLENFNIQPRQNVQNQFKYYTEYLVTLLIEGQEPNQGLNQPLKEVFQQMKQQYEESERTMLQNLRSKENGLKYQRREQPFKANMDTLDMNLIQAGTKVFNLELKKTLDHYMSIMYKVKRDGFFFNQNLQSNSLLIYDKQAQENGDMNVFIQTYVNENEFTGEQTYKANLLLDLIEFLEEKNVEFKIFYHEQSKEIFTSLTFTEQDIGHESFLYEYFIHNSYEIELEFEIVQYTINNYTLRYLDGQSQTYKDVQINHNGEHIEGLEHLTEQDRESAYQLLKVLANSDDQQSEQARFIFNNWDKLTKLRMIRRMLLKRLI